MDQVLKKRLRRGPKAAIPEKLTKPVIPKMLESPFVLWLLSAAFISLGSWGYSLWDTARKEETALLARVAKLDDEIQYRFTRGNLFVKFRTLDPRQSMPPMSHEHQLAVGSFTRSVMRAPDKDQTLFLEFAERGMISLVKELELSLLKAKEISPNSAVLLRSSVDCVYQAFALLSGIDETERQGLFTIPEARARALVASAYRWGYRESLTWTQALRQNQVTKEDVERLLDYAAAQTSGPPCQSRTMLALMNDAKKLQPVGQATP